jgi:hypothetical protein
LGAIRLRALPPSTNGPRVVSMYCNNVITYHNSVYAFNFISNGQMMSTRGFRFPWRDVCGVWVKILSVAPK